MIRDPGEFYQTRPTIDRVDLANAIVQMLEDDADELDRLRTFAVGVRGMLRVVFPSVSFDELVVDGDQCPPLRPPQQRVVGDD